MEGSRPFRRGAGDQGKGDYGMPERVSRQWVVERSAPGEPLGRVPIPSALRDGLVTHAVYRPDCMHVGTAPERHCACETDEAVEWELSEHRG